MCPVGLEPTTDRLEGGCSVLLSYGHSAAEYREQAQLQQPEFGWWPRSLLHSEQARPLVECGSLGKRAARRDQRVLPVPTSVQPSQEVPVFDSSVTIIGTVVTDVRPVTTSDIPISTFRIASAQRRRDAEGRWYDAHITYLTVVCWRGLARNVFASITKGEPVVVTGRLKVRTWEDGDRSGTAVELIATSVGHDLSRGLATYRRLHRGPQLGGLPAGAVEALNSLHTLAEPEDPWAAADAERARIIQDSGSSPERPAALGLAGERTGTPPDQRAA